jgi:hypothetical protein
MFRQQFIGTDLTICIAAGYCGLKLQDNSLHKQLQSNLIRDAKLTTIKPYLSFFLASYVLILLLEFIDATVTILHSVLVDAMVELWEDLDLGAATATATAAQRRFFYSCVKDIHLVPGPTPTRMCILPGLAGTGNPFDEYVARRPIGRPVVIINAIKYDEYIFVGGMDE